MTGTAAFDTEPGASAAAGALPGKPAPWFAEIASPESTSPEAEAADSAPQVVWLRAADGIRLRAAFWSAQATPVRGTVLLLTGRTEYIEKYHPTALALTAAGFAVASLDWRGQGLSDRALPDRTLGHIGGFDEYQRDLDALVAAVDGAGLPGPRFLLSHSMGGAIALRGLLRGLGVRAAAFSAPMWGIAMNVVEQPTAEFVSAMAGRLGQRHRLTPTTGRRPYVASHAFAGNLLTGDRAIYDWMIRQITTHPELALAGPSLGWLRAALDECRDLSRQPAPALPCLTVCGSAERVVSPRAIRQRMAGWPGAIFDSYPGVRHEVLMEQPATRERFLSETIALFAAHSA